MVSFLMKAALLCLPAVIFYYFYIPVPDGMPADDKWLMRKIFVYHQIGNMICTVGQLIGYDSDLNIRRSFRHVFKVSPGASTDVHAERLIWDGVPVVFYTKKSWSIGDQTGKKDDELRPAIFFIHGGGWVFGHSEIHAVFERRLVEDLDQILVSVDYRLAPEHPYPTPFNDCLTALLYFQQHALDLGVNPSKITIVGDSAGGNIAAALTLKLRDSGRNFLHRQILISPATQVSTFLSQSAVENKPFSIFVTPYFPLTYMNVSLDLIGILATNGHVSERILQHPAWSFINKYHAPELIMVRDEVVAKALEEKLMDPYLWPMTADSLAGLPPALVLLSEYDVLRDDAQAYADRLQSEGTETVVEKTDGFHGVYCLFQHSNTGESMVQSIVKYMRTTGTS